MNEDLIAEYTRSLRIPVYDVGPKNTLKFGSALRLVQETSEQHLGLTHVSYEELRSKAGLVFFIISTRVKIHRMPLHSEKVVIKTHPRGRGGAQFYRDFKFYAEDGSLLIDVMQTTILADAETHKIHRPQELRPFGIYPEFNVEQEERMERFRVPESLPKAGERRVFHSDLDANGHMNNSVYGDVVSDFIPDSIRDRAETVQINYISETPEGDVLKIIAGEENGYYLMRGDNAAGTSFTARVKTKEQESTDAAK